MPCNVTLDHFELSCADHEGKRWLKIKILVFCFLMKDNNDTDVYNTEPSNKLFVSVLPQKMNPVCHTATELYGSFVGSALACGISSDWAGNHEETHDISVLNHHSAAATGTKEGLSFRFTPPARVSQFTRPLHSRTGQPGLHHWRTFIHAVFLLQVLFFKSDVTISKHSFNVCING